MLILIIILLALYCFIMFVKWKNIKTDSILLVNGPVGSGKSSTSLYICKVKYKIKVALYYLKNYFLMWLPLLIVIKKRKYLNKCLLKFKYKEKPLLYSNIPLYGLKYVLLNNTDILKRRNWRFAYNSILYLNEASLIANSMSYKIEEINEGLNLFVKLIRHEMRGSGLCMIIDTQSPNDLHYSADRSINQALWIEKSQNIPFFRLLWLREIAINRKDVSNVYLDDVKEDNSLRFYIVPKSIFKNYDSHAYSVLTDYLPPLKNTTYTKSKPFIKKRFHIATWLRYKEIEENNEIVKKEKEEENE